MKNAILALLVLGFIAVSVSCSSGGKTADSTTSQGGTVASVGGTSSGGQSGTGGASSTGGATTASVQTGSAGNSGGSAGQKGSGGTTGSAGATATGGQLGSAGAAGGSAGQTASGSTAGSAGGTATGGQSVTSGTGGSPGRDGGSDASRGTGGVGAGGRSGGGGGSNGGAGAGGSASGGSNGGTTSAAGTGAASPSKGCGKAATLTSGSRTISSGGQSRSFIMRIPSNYDNNHPYRLIFAFHWNGGTMSDIDGGGTSGAVWSYYGLQAQANNSTIFVAPQGNGNGWANSGGADLKFVDDMVALIEGDLCVDTTRLFSVGFSYGGGMSYAIACAEAKVFRAVAVYSGAQLSGCQGGKDPIAYLGIHGVSDGTCAISGGRGLRDTFVKNNGCTAQSPPEPAAGSGTHKCTTYEGCTAGYPVEWCAFDGGHTPGNVDGGGDDGAKTWTKTEVWKFFTQF